ncbi:MAG: class I SAM-dependent methyltransferase [Desulfovibrio sp.]|nr:class I SAM-dependent methyltransferase [Desulfovibrio sp.]MBI4957961.1 class I SAM-dependent methyltransferase [Desulfovibrio sp.]
MADDISLRHENERKQRELLEDLFGSTGFSTFEMFRNFPVFTPRYNLARFLVHYELFKKVHELPGAIVDLGVFRGASTFTFAKLCEIFCPTDVRKVVYGFDTFKGFPEVSEADGKELPEVERVPGGLFGGETVPRVLNKAQEAMNADKHLRHINRIQFVEGDMCQTIPRFVEDQGPGLRIALLNIDCDLYEPTKVALEHFAPLMVPGGVIILDEYALVTFGGESQAVDEYFRATFGKRPRINKFAWHSVPSGYIVVDW